jgi:hypothetical protein
MAENTKIREGMSPSEWVMVPREPTEAMIEAYCTKLHELGFTSWVNFSTLWPIMIAASPSPVSGGGWRTMESAPRDGTVVLLWAAHWRSPETGWTFGDDSWQDCPKDSYVRPPTHWMPLPALPLSGGEGGTSSSCTNSGGTQPCAAPAAKSDSDGSH